MSSVETLESLHARARDLHDFARHAGTGSQRRHFLRSLVPSLGDAALTPFHSAPWGPLR